MKKVIYTGNFSSRWGYFHGVQPWHIKSMYAQNRYAERHGSAYKVVDNSYDDMQKIYSLFRSVSNERADGWTLGTLVTIAAIREFSYSDYDLMGWLDMDIFIQKPHINIFDHYNPGSFCIQNYEPNEYPLNILHKKFFVESIGLEYKRYCRAGYFVIDRQVAYDILGAMKDQGIDLFNESFARKTCEQFLSYQETEEGKNASVSFLCDECIFDMCVSMDRVRLQFPDHPVDSHIVQNDQYDRNLDCFNFHFAGSTKYLMSELL